MTSKAQITKVAGRDGVDARVVERDYVLAHVVALIADSDTERRLVFKGGTSLRLLHVERYRYSADLDYSVINGSEAAGREVIRAALARPRSDTIKSLSLDDASDRISYAGAERSIKLDLADDELVVNTEARPLLKRWIDQAIAVVRGGAGHDRAQFSDRHVFVPEEVRPEVVATHVRGERPHDPTVAGAPRLTRR